MSPTTPTTVTRIDPAQPLLWRDADTIQFGLDGTLRVPLTAPWIEPLLQRMRSGFRRSAFDVIAHGIGAPREDARALLAALEPILITDRPPLPCVWIESIDIDDSRVDARMELALCDEGFGTAPRGAAGSVGIVLVQGAASAHRLGSYLRDDLTHVPVAFEPGATVVGPLIVPGRTPCLSCRDAHERDRDPAWPGMHAQLIGANCGQITTTRTAEAAGLIARLLGDADVAKRRKSVRISPDGRRVWREATFHEECRCHDQSFRSPEGTATDDAPLGPPNATMSAPAFARRA
ncbi:hypothetical protein SRABI121_00796 [Microbacterium sp. Bi121]|nr:hypothetical protein SRABI121_00796 [Microbacterium sp. Bi121]